MVGGKNLHARTDLRARTDPHWHYIEHSASEIEKHALAEVNVIAIVTVERRSDRRAAPRVTKPFHQQRMTLRPGSCRCAVLAVEPRSGARRVRDEFRIVGDIELACQHPLLLRHRDQLRS